VAATILYPFSAVRLPGDALAGIGDYFTSLRALAELTRC
jgi:hypothetical protein